MSRVYNINAPSPRVTRMAMLLLATGLSLPVFVILTVLGLILG